jgi:hypothetical protein
MISTALLPVAPTDTVSSRGIFTHPGARACGPGEHTRHKCGGLPLLSKFRATSEP